MSTRKMRGPFGRRSIAFVAFAVVVAMAGLVYAHWWTSLNVDANINTGNVGIQWVDAWTNDDGVPNGDDPDADPDNGSNGMFTHWEGGSSVDPAGFGDERYDKDVGRCYVDFGGENIAINIDNGYPSYHCRTTAIVENTGSVPIKALPSNFVMYRGGNQCDWWLDDAFTEMANVHHDDDGPYLEENGFDGFQPGEDRRIFWDHEGGFHWLETDGIAGPAYDPVIYEDCYINGEELAWEYVWDDFIGWGYYNEHDEFVPEIVGFLPDLFGCGDQIDPGFVGPAEFGFHVEQPAAQNAQYTFQMNQEFVNWNEFDYGWCDNGPTVEDGKPDPTEKGFGVRYRNFGTGTGNEVYLGQGNLGDPGRAEQAVTWGPAQHVSFMYDGEGTLTTQVEGYSPLVESGIDESCADFMVMSVVARDPGSAMDLNNVYLNGWNLGDFNATAVAWNEWTVSGIDFAEPFQLDADLLATGPFTISNENNKVELLVGCSP